MCTYSFEMVNICEKGLNNQLFSFMHQFTHIQLRQISHPKSVKKKKLVHVHLITSIESHLLSINEIMQTLKVSRLRGRVKVRYLKIFNKEKNCVNRIGNGLLIDLNYLQAVNIIYSFYLHSNVHSLLLRTFCDYQASLKN